ncbi:hypothetical protein [Escherichia coli]|uniref:hypothetical protein n=1 Tax=Escherichia coli TaxID=562 RepID=UPI000DA565F8|nr:hypothetical protein [Escherichia coli]SQK57776.1 Uncharacterised protein [Escherichia coli]
MTSRSRQAAYSALIFIVLQKKMGDFWYFLVENEDDAIKPLDCAPPAQQLFLINQIPFRGNGVSELYSTQDERLGGEALCAFSRALVRYSETSAGCDYPATPNQWVDQISSAAELIEPDIGDTMRKIYDSGVLSEHPERAIILCSGTYPWNEEVDAKVHVMVSPKTALDYLYGTISNEELRKQCTVVCMGDPNLKPNESRVDNISELPQSAWCNLDFWLKEFQNVLRFNNDWGGNTVALCETDPGHLNALDNIGLTPPAEQFREH